MEFSTISGVWGRNPVVSFAEKHWFVHNCSQVLIATEIEPNELGLDLDLEDETTSNGRINSINNK